MPPPTQLKEDTAHLLLSWQTGDAGSGKALYRNFGAAIKRYFRRRVSLIDDVADLVQETFLRCQTTVYRRDGSVRSLLFGIAHNVFLEYLRRRDRRGDERSYDDLLEQPIADFIPDPEYVLGQKQELRLLMKAMRRLPQRYQLVLELSRWEGLTQSEIATLLSRPGTPIPASTIGRWKSEAVAALEAKMHELTTSSELRDATTMTIMTWRRWAVAESQRCDTNTRAATGR